MLKWVKDKYYNKDIPKKKAIVIIVPDLGSFYYTRHIRISALKF